MDIGISLEQQNKENTSSKLIKYETGDTYNINTTPMGCKYGHIHLLNINPSNCNSIKNKQTDFFNNNSCQ